MARSILISDSDIDGASCDLGVGYNTLVFEVITEGIRGSFASDQAECRKKCFESLDEFGLDYLSLCEIDSCCFQAFEKACVLGLEKLKESREVANDYQASPVEIDGFISLWEDLIIELHKDVRYF